MTVMDNNPKSPKLLPIMLMAVVLAALPVFAGGAKSPPKEPAKVKLTVAPEAVAAGGEAEVTLALLPKDGIKINRYPKIKLTVAAVDGLVDEAVATVGNDNPPPVDNPESNYFKTVDPVRLDLSLDAAAPKGKHKLQGKLKYYYCVAASGFCAPAKADVTIPITVR